MAVGIVIKQAVRRFCGRAVGRARLILVVPSDLTAMVRALVVSLCSDLGVGRDGP